MGLVKSPLHPYAANCPNPFSRELEAARALFEKEIDSMDGWEEHGEHKDVKLEKKKLDPAENGKSVVPMVRGTCIVENVTTDDLSPVIQTPGIRKKWDPRFETAWIQRRFSSTCYQFYSLGNSPPGLGWLIYPRDIVGVHQGYVDGQTDDSCVGKNKEIVLIQTSVVDKERAPEQWGKTRMTLGLSAWRLRPRGNDVEVTYLCKVSLGGSIPAGMVATVIVDVPKCAGKLRDTYYEYGAPPYIVHSDPHGTRSIEQSLFFHYGVSKNGVHEPVPNDKHFHLHMTGVKDGHFEIRYDIKRMYASEGGVHITVRGNGKDGVTTVNDGQGTVYVKVHEKADGQNFEIILSPLGQAVIAPDS